MNRGPVHDIDAPFVSPLPVRRFVPGLLLDDPLYVELCAAVDELLAPTMVALDCLPAYLDPALAPEDFLPWLAELVGADTGSDVGATRVAIAGAVAGHGLRGTPEGLRRLAALAAEVPVEQVRLYDPGVVTWSEVPTAGGAAAAFPVAVLSVPAASDAEIARVRSAVSDAIDASRPVHCVVEIEVTA